MQPLGIQPRVPKRVAGVDLQRVKLDPTDGFVLSRANGVLDISGLARETGLPEFTVERVVEKLVKLGIFEFVDPDSPETNAATQRSALAEFSVSLSEPKYDVRELDEAVELSVDQKKRVLDLYYRLDDLDHYTLLGVTKETERKAIKRAYFELAAFMHPDRYFKKNLGSFKIKMELLFGRITQAHDVLVDAARRVEYDAYLSEVATTRGMEAMLERALEESARSDVETANAEELRIEATALEPGEVASVLPLGPSRAELQARREAFARRLLGGRMSPGRPDSQPPGKTRTTSTTEAMEDLKRRYTDHMTYTANAEAQKYIRAGEEALAKNDIVGAAGAYAIAVKFAPHDAALAMRFQELKNESDEHLVQSYRRQAAYEDRACHWPEAARSWEKVAAIAPADAKAHERVAFALLQMGTDLHRAAERARHAISLEPRQAGYHATLAEIYIKAGLMASARGAADAGLLIDAEHKTLLSLQRRLSKG